MALPYPGDPLSFSQIYAEIYGSHSSQQASLRTMSAAATPPKNTPDAVSEFYLYSHKELKFNYSYHFYWEHYEAGSTYYQQANVTITPSATFSVSDPLHFTRTINQTSDYVRIYPTSQNFTTSSLTGTATLTASGYSCTGDCTVSLTQGPFNTCTLSSPTCLIGDSIITMADESEKRIADLKTGDKILGFDFISNKKVVSTVGKIGMSNHENLVQIKYNNTEIICTIDHPFFIEGKRWSSLSAGYTNRMYSNIPNHCQKIELGDKILTAYDGFKSIESIIFFDKMTPTYQITEADHINYYVNGVLSLIEVNTNQPKIRI